MEPDLPVPPSKDFVDLRTEDLTSGEMRTNNFEGEEYQNGIRVVAGKYRHMNELVKVLHGTLVWLLRS